MYQKYVYIKNTLFHDEVLSRQKASAGKQRARLNNLRKNKATCSVAPDFPSYKQDDYYHHDALFNHRKVFD